METVDGLEAELTSTREALAISRQEIKDAKDRESKLLTALGEQTKQQQSHNISSYLGFIVLLGIVALAVLQIIHVIQLNKLIG